MRKVTRIKLRNHHPYCMFCWQYHAQTEFVCNQINSKSYERHHWWYEHHNLGSALIATCWYYVCIICMKRARWSQWAPTPGSPPALPAAAIALRWRWTKTKKIISLCLVFGIFLGNEPVPVTPQQRASAFLTAAASPCAASVLPAAAWAMGDHDVKRDFEFPGCTIAYIHEWWIPNIKTII